MVPLTRGSTTTLWPDKVAKVLATASMSALLKLSVTGSADDLAEDFFSDFFSDGCGCACATLARAKQIKGKLISKHHRLCLGNSEKEFCCVCGIL